MTTIVDVARMAKVSVSTVSHVINGTKPVSDETRQRVDEAIRRSQYTPHRIARSLRSGRTDSIGLVVSDTSQFVFGRMIAAIEAEIRKAGLTLLLANSAEDRDQEQRIVRALLDNRVDGIIIAPVADSDPNTLKMCSDAGCPVVLMDRTLDPMSDQVGTDNRSAMGALVNHLIALGHSNIALIAGDTDVWTIRERLLAFRETLEAAGLKGNETSVLKTRRGLRDCREEIEEFLVGINATAVVAASGLLTLGALRAFRQLRISVPSDLAFVSFDGVMNADLLEPHLTAALHRVELIGQEATSLLLRRISEPDSPPRTIQTQARLEHGTSCGCAPGTPLALPAALSA